MSYINAFSDARIEAEKKLIEDQERKMKEEEGKPKYFKYFFYTFW